MTTRLPWETYTAQMRRLAFLPGGERVSEEDWKDWYTHVSGYFPKELERAVTTTLMAPDTKFFPGPGVIKDRMDTHRKHAGGNDWDSTLAALEAEERGEEPPQLAERVDFDEPIPLLTRAQEEAR